MLASTDNLVLPYNLGPSELAGPISLVSRTFTTLIVSARVSML